MKNLYILTSCIILLLSYIISVTSKETSNLKGSVILISGTMINYVPAKITVSKLDNEEIITLSARNLSKNYDMYVGDLVRIKGLVDYTILDLIWIDTGRSQLGVFKYGAGTPGRARWKEDYYYEITGLLIKYERHAEYQPKGYITFAIYPLEVKELHPIE